MTFFYASPESSMQRMLTRVGMSKMLLGVLDWPKSWQHSEDVYGWASGVFALEFLAHASGVTG